jgi:hypothetical protein
MGGGSISGGGTGALYLNLVLGIFGQVFGGFFGLVGLVLGVGSDLEIGEKKQRKLSTIFKPPLTYIHVLERMTYIAGLASHRASSLLHFGGSGLQVLDTFRRDLASFLVDLFINQTRNRIKTGCKG